ncbi:hypothetical protein C8R44DRAFT_741313 [Mycena epipterygia]|nr:hypothetical protein C8R44DRAFT_741313 [Mycena epipterygia]
MQNNIIGTRVYSRNSSGSRSSGRRRNGSDSGGLEVRECAGTRLDSVGVDLAEDDSGGRSVTDASMEEQIDTPRPEGNDVPFHIVENTVKGSRKALLAIPLLLRPHHREKGAARGEPHSEGYKD